MNLTFRFFDKETWSTYGVHKTFVILMLFILFRQSLTTTNLILMSLLSMMEGGLIEKILFTGFLLLMISQPTIQWVIQSILFVVSIVLIHYIPQNNRFQIMFTQSTILMWVMRIASFAWMSYILFNIIKPFSKLIYY
jgi:hypothetical protein